MSRGALPLRPYREAFPLPDLSRLAVGQGIGLLCPFGDAPSVAQTPAPAASSLFTRAVKAPFGLRFAAALTAAHEHS